MSYDEKPSDKEMALILLKARLKAAADYCWIANDIIQCCTRQGILTGEEPEVLETKALLARVALEGLDWINPNYLQGQNA